MNIVGYGKTLEEDIVKFEKEIKFRLPDDYRNFLLTFNGGVPKDKYSYFKLNGVEECIGLQVLYGLNVDVDLDLKEWFDEYNGDLLDDSIIIGHGLGFGFIVLINSPDVSGIYFWDHTFELDCTSEDENVYKISDSFSDFINALKKPEEK